MLGRKGEVRQLEMRWKLMETAGKSFSHERKEKLTERLRLTGQVSDRTEKKRETECSRLDTRAPLTWPLALCTQRQGRPTAPPTQLSTIRLSALCQDGEGRKRGEGERGEQGGGRRGQRERGKESTDKAWVMKDDKIIVKMERIQTCECPVSYCSGRESPADSVPWKCPLLWLSSHLYLQWGLKCT